MIVSDWLTSGHGAWVQPYEISSSCKLEGLICQPEPYPAYGSSKVLGCIDGYQPNEGNTECVAVKPELCGEGEIVPPTNTNNGGSSSGDGDSGSGGGSGSGSGGGTSNVVVVSMNQLLYGNGSDNCWKLTNSTEYKACVLNGIE